MKIENLSDRELHQKTKDLVSAERQLVTEILRHLAEVESRRLFSAWGCSSLFDYCMKELGYSESQAHRRITAMRLIREIPEVEEKMASGALNLTIVTQAQTFFNHESKQAKKKMDPSEKRAVLESLENTSTREAEKTLVALSSHPDVAIAMTSGERTCRVGEDLIEMRLNWTQKQMDQIHQLRGLLAHTMPHANYADLISAACEMAITKLQEKREPKTSSKLSTKDSPKRKSLTKQSETPKESKSQGDFKSLFVSESKSLTPGSLHSASPLLSAQQVGSHSETSLRMDSQDSRSLDTRSANSMGAKNRRTPIPITTRRQVWQRDGGKCTLCQSAYALELDHLVPVACGGGNEPDNLRVLCRLCNQRAAIVQFGLDKMKSYLKPGSLT